MKSLLIIGMVFLGSLGCMTAAEVTVQEDGIQKQDVLSIEAGTVTELVLIKSVNVFGLLADEIFIGGSVLVSDDFSLSINGILLDSRETPRIRDGL